MCGLFEQLYSDKSPRITEAYIEKTEEFLNSIFEIFIKPDLEGLAPVYPRYDRQDQTYLFKTTHETSFGCTSSNGDIIINTGVLYLAQTAFTPEPFRPSHNRFDNENYERKSLQKNYKTFLEFRNKILGDLVDTVAHEYRHYMQKLYLELLQCPKINAALILRLKNKLGPCTEELEKEGLAALFGDCSNSWMEYEILSEFALDNNLITQQEYSNFSDRLLRPDTCYELMPHEKDARNYANKVMWEISKHLRKHHSIAKQMQKGALLKQEELNTKFYNLANARIDFVDVAANSIDKEFQIRRDGKEADSLSKKMASKLTIDTLKNAALQYLESYDLPIDADMGFCYALDLLLKNKHFDNFFQNANLFDLCSSLKKMDFNLSANRLEEKIADLEDETANS